MKSFFIVILFSVSFIFAACADQVARGRTAELSSNHAPNTASPSPTPTPADKSLINKSNQCQTKNVSSDEMISPPDSRETFDAWLNGIVGSVRVAALPNRQFVSEYFWEGDLNGDGCQDIAILVQGIKDKSGAISTKDFSVGTTVQNLRTKTTYKNVDAVNFPFSKEFAQNLKPKQKIAVAVVFGGRKGWSWKQNAAGRGFLLYDSAVLSEAKGYEAVSTIFSIVKKDKPDDDDDDLSNLIPTNAVGDCIYTATQFKRKKVEFAELRNKSLVCFDGEVFFDKKLPDSKLYPE